MNAHQVNLMRVRVFAFETRYTPPEDIMFNFKVVLTDTDGKDFHYLVTAVGFRSAFTDAKRQHATLPVLARLPIQRVVTEQILP